jgi:predicted DCC family thiol-disulfide oxidoreductase YuxK
VVELTIFYDGGCPLCAAEISHIQRLDTDKKMAFEDIYAPHFSKRFPHIDQQQADLILHGEWKNGGMIYGLDVTYHSWALVGKGHWVAVFRWPFFKQVANIGYRFFARYRHRISAFVTGKPRCERCDISGTVQ